MNIKILAWRGNGMDCVKYWAGCKTLGTAIN